MKDWLSEFIEKKVQEKLAQALEKKTHPIPRKPVPPVKARYRKNNIDEDYDPVHSNDRAVKDTLETMKKLRDTLSPYRDKEEDK